MSNAELVELFAGYTQYYDDREAEIQASAFNMLSLEELAQESGRRCRTLEEFGQFWVKVCADPERKARWLRRFEPDAYERERAEADEKFDQHLLQILSGK